MALIKKLTMKHINYYYFNVALKHFHVLSTQYDITVQRVWFGPVSDSQFPSWGLHILFFLPYLS